MAAAKVDPALLLYAFGYALGKRNHAVSDTCRALSVNARLLHSDYRRGIIRDINEAIAQGLAGDEREIRQWEKLADDLTALEAVNA